jgi:hypothetical protein
MREILYTRTNTSIEKQATQTTAISTHTHTHIPTQIDKQGWPKTLILFYVLFNLLFFNIIFPYFYLFCIQIFFMLFYLRGAFSSLISIEKRNKKFY